MSTDRTHVRDLLVRAVIGVHEHERRERQDLLVNLELELDLARAADSDDLADTVDYGALARSVVSHVEESRFRLLERLAGSVAALCLESDARVQAVTVRVDKPRALRYARSVAVELRRERS